MSITVQTGRPSLWRGSEHVGSHGWDFDCVETLLGAAATIAAESPASDRTLGYRHTADRATSLPDAAAAYRCMAAAAIAMHHAGGMLAAVDDDILVVEYPAR